MNMLVFALSITVIAMVVGVFLLFIFQFYNIIFKSYAPFISTKPRIIARIIENLEVGENPVIYELGCGRAGFLGAAAKKFPSAELIGLECAALPYLVAQIQHSLAGTPVSILRRDMFRENLSKADVIYCYLNYHAMAGLEKKLTHECRPGTRVISYMYSFPNLKPARVLTGNKDSEKIYFYTL